MRRGLFLRRRRALTTKYKTYSPTKWKFTNMLSWWNQTCSWIWK